MTTILEQENYTFHNLADWDRFYRANRNIIHQKQTQWLNNRIHIEDEGKQYRIIFRKNKLYLKPQVKIDVKQEQESAQLHALNLILEKLDELFEIVNTESRLPHKAVIEKVKKKSN